VQEPILGQQNEVLVAIQFPDDFVISGARGIEVGNAAEVLQAGFDTGEGIASPVNFGSGFERETEGGEAVGADFGG